MQEDQLKYTIRYDLEHPSNATDDNSYYRIQALRDIPEIGVKKGDIGGYISQYFNLSQKGTCWLFDDSKAVQDSRVYQDALLYNNVSVYENARIFGSSCLKDNVIVSERAKVFNSANVSGNADISGLVKIFGNAEVYGYTEICDNAWVFENAHIHGKNIYEYEAKIGGNTRIYGDVVLGPGTYIQYRSECTDKKKIVALHKQSDYIGFDIKRRVEKKYPKYSRPIPDTVHLGFFLNKEGAIQIGSATCGAGMDSYIAPTSNNPLLWKTMLHSLLCDKNYMECYAYDFFECLKVAEEKLLGSDIIYNSSKKIYGEFKKIFR